MADFKHAPTQSLPCPKCGVQSGPCLVTDSWGRVKGEAKHSHNDRIWYAEGYNDARRLAFDKARRRDVEALARQMHGAYSFGARDDHQTWSDLTDREREGWLRAAGTVVADGS